MSDTLRSAAPSVETRIDIFTGEKKANKKTYRNGRSESHWVQYLNGEYYDRIGLTQRNRDSEEENHRMYTGLEFGQWPKELVDSCGKKMLSQFNVMQKKVNSMVGNLKRNWYDVDYITTDGTNSDDISLMKDLYYTDKEICDWEPEFTTLLKNGAIRGGDMMMYIDYRHDANFGNIGLKTLVPGSVLWDVNWVDNNSGNCKNAFTVRYMTPNEMKIKYPEMSERIDMLIRIKASESDENVHNGVRDSIPRRDLREDYNNTYRVIEYHHMEKELEEFKTGVGHNGQPVVIPEDADDAWYEYNKVNPENTWKSKVNTDVYYVTAFAPDLDLSKPLFEGYGSLQIGRLPLFHWSYNRHNGRDVGLVDFLKDAQIYMNEMMSLTHEVMTRTRRVQFVDPEAFGYDTANLDELREKWENANDVMFMEPGASREFQNGGVIPSQASTYTGQEMNFVQQVQGFFNEMGVTTQAMEGIGGNERSALQFDLKREQGEINMALVQSSIKNFLNEIGEAYFYAAQDLYGGMYREFNSSFGSVEINVPQEDGRVLNDITAIPRGKVLVTESPDALSRNSHNRSVAFKVLEIMGATNPAVANEASKIIFGSIDALPNSTKKEMDQVFDLQGELLKAQSALAYSQTELGLASTEMQKQQMMNPQPPMPMEGEAPQEGQAPPEEQMVEEPVQQ